MTYQEMVDALASMSEEQRRRAIQAHWQSVLSDGFIAFVQGQIEAGRSMALADGSFREILEGLDEKAATALKQQALRQVARLVEVWDSMVAVYHLMQTQSAQQGPRGGMVDHGRHQAMPRGVSVTAAAACFRCGSPASGNGLCGGCTSTEQDWQQDDLDYQQQAQDRQTNDLQYQRIQQDQIYYSNQQDYNNYP